MVSILDGRLIGEELTHLLHLLVDVHEDGVEHFFLLGVTDLQ